MKYRFLVLAVACFWVVVTLVFANPCRASCAGADVVAAPVAASSAVGSGCAGTLAAVGDGCAGLAGSAVLRATPIRDLVARSLQRLASRPRLAVVSMPTGCGGVVSRLARVRPVVAVQAAVVVPAVVAAPVCANCPSTGQMFGKIEEATLDSRQSYTVSRWLR